MTQRPGDDSMRNVPPSLAARLAALSPEKRALVEAQLRASRAAAPATGPKPLPADVDAPLSFAQELLWLIQLADPATSAYNVPRALRLRGAIDPSALQRALDAVVERHEILRTRIEDGPHGLRQRVARAEPVALETIDLRAAFDRSRDATLHAALVERARRPFDLSRDQLLRATLARTGDDEHVLLLVTHHVASDGASREILYRELAAYYAAARHGARAELPPLAIQYRDYSAWQRERLSGSELERLLGWWRTHFDGAPRRLELPTDRAARDAGTFEGARRFARLGRAARDAVTALADRERVTPFVVLLTATQVLLARHARQTDVVVGSVLSGRAHPEVEGLLGLFSTMLPLRAAFADDPSFRDALARNRAATLEALDHAELPFEKLALELHPGGDGYAPLAQVSVSMLDDGPSVPALEGTTAEPMLLDRGIAKFDFTVAFGLEADDLLAIAEYRTDLFEASTVDAWLAQLGTLLAAAVREPECPVSRISLLDAAARREVLDRWNPAPAGELPAATLHEWITGVASARRDEVAVECDGRTLTYGELLDRSASLAARLQGVGVTEGARVGVFMERDCELLVAMLAVLRAGAAYVPVDPAYPALRTAMMFEDAVVAAVITDLASESALPRTSAPVLRVSVNDEPGELTPAAPITSRDDAARAESLAYVLFTSGSTGRPKGVMVPHRALVNFLASMAREPGLAPGDATLAVTTVSFDIAGLELWLPLVTGARVVLAPRRVTTDGMALATLLERARADAVARGRRLLVQATPATWRMLIDAGWSAGSRAAGVVALCGGEAWPAGLAEQLLVRVDELWNVYGPTETTIWSSLERVRDAGTLALGAPLRDTRFYVLEPHGEPAALGMPGELFIGGAGVALGYLGRADLTAERFVLDPFTSTVKDWERRDYRTMYRTGDLVRRRADGRLEFLGRLDAQVKVRGHRIELEEVEAAIASHPAVRQVAAAVHGTADEARLVAHVVVTGGVAADSELATVLRSHAAARLPAYMVPAIAWLDALPLTPNGKVDRRALRAPSDVVRTTAYVEPHTPTERAMAALWRDTLRVERVGADDRFVERGGHSLLALRMMGRAQATLGAPLPIAELLRGATLAELCAQIDAVRAPEDLEEEEEALVPVARDGYRRSATTRSVGA